MTYQAISVTPCSPHIGAEIADIDLTRPLSNQQVAELHEAFTQHLVIFFRDQKISFDDQIRLAGYFGPLGRHVGVNTISKTTDNPLVRKFHYDETSKKISGENWHSDQSCAAVPPLGSMLYNHTIPPDGGGDTMFASMYAAYDALSEPMKRFLAPLTAMHEGEHVYRGRYGVKDEGKIFPKAEHPVIRTHPVSGRKALFVNSGFTTRIVQLKRAESDALLQFLFRHIETPEFQCRFRWQERSVAFWDNRCVQHHAMWDYFPQRRHGHRVTIRGDKPFYRP